MSATAAITAAARKTRRAVAGLLVLSAAVAGCSPGDGNGPLGWGADPLSIQRPGYPPNGPAMGDPAALVSAPGSATAVVYRGRPVVQACDLVTPEDLTGTGLLLVPATSTGLVERTYLDGHGNTDLPGSDGGVHIETNTCHYVVGVDPNLASVTLQVHQSSYVDPEHLGWELDDYRGSRRIGAVEVLQPKRPVGEFATPWLRYQDIAVELTVGPFPQQLTTRLVEAIAARLPEVAAHPGGPRRFGYRSPIFPANYLNACEISSADDFQAIFGTPPGPSVRESIAPAVGRIQFLTQGGLSANGATDVPVGAIS